VQLRHVVILLAALSIAETAPRVLPSSVRYLPRSNLNPKTIAMMTMAARM
jgi:hypothetical protein